MSEHTTIPKGATVDISILEKPDPFQSCNNFAMALDSQVGTSDIDGELTLRDA